MSDTTINGEKVETPHRVTGRGTEQVGPSAKCWWQVTLCGMKLLGLIEHAVLLVGGSEVEKEV